MTLIHCTTIVLAGACLASDAGRTVAPEILETRTVRLTQTVTLHDIPVDAKVVRMWVPVPSDGAWQRVVDCQVVSAPGSWRLVRQDEGRGDFVYVELNHPSSATASVKFQCTVRRDGVHFPIEGITADPIQPELFEADLDKHAPLMEVDNRVQALADKACGDERDPAKQALLLVKSVADNYDHYSKDPSEPKCGRGAAGDCMDHGGGCCTDMHSLFIAMARARGIPARIQYGYRLLDAKAGSEFDPGYRCWVEYFISGAGWVPTDIVAADAVEPANAVRWASLSAARVWLWRGRNFNLAPKAKAGPINTMICGWAEIDGAAVDPLPTPDGAPSKLTRTVKFDVLEKSGREIVAKLPE